MKSLARHFLAKFLGLLKKLYTFFCVKTTDPDLADEFSHGLISEFDYEKNFCLFVRVAVFEFIDYLNLQAATVD